ncbi:MAG: TetR/AcrR family transcriptional regulator [Acidobacteriota bacterium]
MMPARIKTKRRYQMQLRAERQNETRQRIVEATVELHEAIGSAKTTVSAIAERAGVERLTVYRHFPDERALFTACTSHYLAKNPPPDPEPWQEIADPEQRLRVGLTAIYAYHRRTERMSKQNAREIEERLSLREVLRPFFLYWERVVEILRSPWKGRASRHVQIRALIGHAVGFQTWYSLVRDQKLSEAEAVDLVVSAVRCLDSQH